MWNNDSNYRRSRHWFFAFFHPDEFYNRTILHLDVVSLFKKICRMEIMGCHHDHIPLYLNCIGQRLCRNIPNNKDLQIILVHGYLALYASILTLFVFFIVFIFNNGSTDLNAVGSPWDLVVFFGTFLVIGFLLFVVISTWSIIPSTLASMFTTARRNFWTSSIYTGGTIVGFAGPFVSIQIIQQYDHVWLLLPLIIGCLSIIMGSRSLIIKNPVRFGTAHNS